MGACVLASVLLMSACAGKEAKPDDLLPKKEMVKVMSEIYLLEQKVNALGLPRDSLEQIFSVMKDRIFAKAGTSDATFKRSLKYYLDQPKTVEDLYTALIDSLNLREQKMISNEVKK
jgi:hypothetical protein